MSKMSKTPVTDKVEQENQHLPLTNQLWLMTNLARNLEESAGMSDEWRRRYEDLLEKTLEIAKLYGRQLT